MDLLHSFLDLYFCSWTFWDCTRPMILYEKDLDVVTEAAKGDQWTHCCVHDTSVTRIIIRLEAATKMVRCTWSATIGIQIMTALLPQGQIQQIFLIPPILLSVTAVTLYTAIHRPSRKSSVNSLLQLCPFFELFHIYYFTHVSYLLFCIFVVCLHLFQFCKCCMKRISKSGKKEILPYLRTQSASDLTWKY